MTSTGQRHDPIKAARSAVRRAEQAQDVPRFIEARKHLHFLTLEKAIAEATTGECAIDGPQRRALIATLNGPPGKNSPLWEVKLARAIKTALAGPHPVDPAALRRLRGMLVTDSELL